MKIKPSRPQDAYIAGQFDGKITVSTCPRCENTNPADVHTCTFLDAPEPTQKPIGTLDHNGNFKLLRMVGIPIGEPMKLYDYPAPRPDFVRLSDKEIKELAVSEEFLLFCDQDEFNQIARAVEHIVLRKQQGIGREE